jgi:hypothetical protein
MPNHFHVARSQSGFRVELHRGGEPYVTFVDGLSKEAAEQEARTLDLLWQKIRVNAASPPAVAKSDKDD